MADPLGKHVVAAILAALAAGVEVRWATSWIGDTGALDQALGLPELPIAFELHGSRDSALVSAGKLAAALAVSGRHRLVWTDDEAIPAVGADRDKLTAGGALLVAPKSYRGLRPDDIAAINDYLAGGNAPAIAHRDEKSHHQEASRQESS